jgi:hypothetical protein
LLKKISIRAEAFGLCGYGGYITLKVETQCAEKKTIALKKKTYCTEEKHGF